MKNIPNFNIEIAGVEGEIFVSDNDGDKYMCVFVNNGVTDFSGIYNAYGFMVWALNATRSELQYYPIKLKEETNLTEDIMQEMWRKIDAQLTLIQDNLP